VDDEDVAVRATLHVLADAQPEQSRHEAWLSGADDDHVRTALCDGLEDHVRRITEADVIRRIDSELVEC
jgi:hypothetical protein